MNPSKSQAFSFNLPSLCYTCYFSYEDSVWRLSSLQCFFELMNFIEWRKQSGKQIHEKLGKGQIGW